MSERSSPTDRLWNTSGPEHARTTLGHGHRLLPGPSLQVANCQGETPDADKDRAHDAFLYIQSGDGLKNPERRRSPTQRD
jgi:hypothetical protein